MKILVDYLTMTSKIHSQAQLLTTFGLSSCVFQELPGRNGWTSRQWFHGISLYTGGREDICLELSGAGCRMVEELSGNTFQWLPALQSYQSDILSRDLTVSRLDIAGDDQEGLLVYRRMTTHCKHHRYICKARFNIWIDGDEQAIYFGSPASDRRLRIYNKAQEQGTEGHWLRAEMQMRNDNAVSFLLNWFKVGEIGPCYGGVLRDFLRFTDTTPDATHYDRATVCTWWEKFLGAVQSCSQLYLDGAGYTLSRVQDFLRRQASSSLRLWVEANGGDLTDILDMIDDARLNHRQEVLLARIRAEMGNKGDILDVT